MGTEGDLIVDGPELTSVTTKVWKEKVFPIELISNVCLLGKVVVTRVMFRYGGWVRRET